MGREVKRVPVDFNWPLKKTWEGYINPHWKPCPADNVSCFGGYSAAAKWLDAICRLIALVGNDAAEPPEMRKPDRRTFPHPYLQEWAQAPRIDVPREEMQRIRAIKDDSRRSQALYHYLNANPLKLAPLDAEFVEFVSGLAWRKSGPFGNEFRSYDIEKALKKTAGISSESWGICKVCDGHAVDPAIREAHEAWNKVEPPEGPAYQIWETVSEGSPVCPPFLDPMKLGKWMVANDTSVTRGTTAEEWAKFCVGPGWAPSMAMTRGQMMDGVKFAVSQDEGSQ
jgi:hypothetical protein